MKINPLNLALRFVLEMAALVAMMLWGWGIGDGFMQYVAAISVPLIAAILWGTFNVPSDPSRSGNAPVAVPGIVRLILELTFFTLAAWMLRDLGQIGLSGLFSLAAIVHYLFSYKRLSWLLSR